MGQVSGFNFMLSPTRAVSSTTDFASVKCTFGTGSSAFPTWLPLGAIVVVNRVLTEVGSTVHVLTPLSFAVLEQVDLKLQPFHSVAEEARVERQKEEARSQIRARARPVTAPGKVWRRRAVDFSGGSFGSCCFMPGGTYEVRSRRGSSSP